MPAVSAPGSYQIHLFTVARSTPIADKRAVALGITSVIGHVNIFPCAIRCGVSLQLIFCLNLLC